MESIAKKELDHIHGLIKKGRAANDTFLTGNLGLCLYYYNLYKVSGEKEHSNKGRVLLEKIFANLNNGNPGIFGSSFGSGGAGLGYIIAMLKQENLLDIDMDHEFSELDHFLYNDATTQIGNDYIDCLHGAFGIIHYFSERQPSGKTNEFLNLLVEKICNKAVKEKQGYWFRNYILQGIENDEINFSLSHGLSGMLMILLEAYEKTDHKALIEETVREGIRFITKHKMYIDFSNGEYSFYPFFIKINASVIENKARMAWCYGDLNQVLLFYRAGKLFQDPELLQLAELVGMHSLMRKDPQSTQVLDSHFCHGSSGVAQFYRILYRETGNGKYLEAYHHWIEQTILLLEKDIKQGLYKGKEHNMLEGLVGVALTLLSYVSEKELTWSRTLFL